MPSAGVSRIAWASTLFSALLYAVLLGVAAIGAFAGMEGWGKDELHFDNRAGVAVPRRIVSLAPSITEILFALGASADGSGMPLVVGRSAFCTRPAAALAVPIIGNMGDPAVEQVLARHPDLVLSTGLTSCNAAEQLRQIGIPALILDHSGIEGILRDIELIGRTIGRRDDALRVSSAIRARLDRIRQATAAHTQAGWRRPRVLFLYETDGIYSAGRGSFPSELIALAGGDNLADAASSPWPQLSMEFVLAAKPDVIVITSMDLDSVASAAAGTNTADAQHSALAKLRADPCWRELAAVREGRVVVIPSGPFNIPGLRLADAAEMLARALESVQTQIRNDAL